MTGRIVLLVCLLVTAVAVIGNLRMLVKIAPLTRPTRAERALWQLIYMCAAVTGGALILLDLFVLSLR